MASVIDISTMAGAGSSLSVNGKTFGVGLQAGQLKSIGSGLPSGVTVSGQEISVHQAGVTLEGYDLRGYNVSVQANNVTIKNNLFNASSWHTVFQGASSSGLVVEYNTFDGQKANNTNADLVFSESGAVTIRNNEFVNLPTDAVNVAGGTIEHNYFAGSGYQSGAHADAISIHRTAAPVMIRENYIDFTDRSDAQTGTNSAIKIVSHFGAIDHVTIDSNVLLGGGYTIYTGDAGNPVSNVTFSNNDIGLSHWGDLYPGDHGVNFIWQTNHDFTTDAHLVSGAVSPPPQPEPIPPSPPADGTGGGTSSILLHVSGDAYLGSPSFDVAVDGVQVATGLLATAIHGQGWADVLVTGAFSMTPSSVAVTFTNDAYGGSASADRNLYIDYIEVNGIRFEGEDAVSNTANTTSYSAPEAASLFSYGTVTFATTAQVPPPPSIPDVPSTPGPVLPPIPAPVIPTNPTPALPSPDVPSARTIKGSARANTLTGTAGDDRLFGYGGSDKLKGGSGNDLLSGGWGKDQMWGGFGDDIYAYNSIADSRPVFSQDTIYDWGDGRNGRGNDLIDLHSIDANVLRGGNQAFKWIGHSGFSGKPGQLRSYFDGHDTIVQADVNGDRVADFQVKLMGKHALTASDFIL